MHYQFYRPKRTSSTLQSNRVYPFSHTYGSNITLHDHPLKPHFCSTGKSTLEGVPDHEVTVQEFFGTKQPHLHLLGVLTYNQEPLGFRLEALPQGSAFYMDIELGCLNPTLEQRILSNYTPIEMMVLPNGNFTTELEQRLRNYVANISECSQILGYINNRLTQQYS